MGRTIFILCAVLLVCASPSLAQEWKFFYEREGTKYYFDKAGVQRPDKIMLRVTERTTKKAEDDDDDARKDEEGVKPGEVEMARAEYEINCKNRSFRILSVTSFDSGTGKEQATEQPVYKPGAPMGIYNNDRVATLYDNLCP